MELDDFFVAILYFYGNPRGGKLGFWGGKILVLENKFLKFLLSKSFYKILILPEGRFTYSEIFTAVIFYCSKPPLDFTLLKEEEDFTIKI